MKIDDRFEKPPIIIGGCGRSGTSLLLSVLSARPNIFAIPHETKAFCPSAYSKNVNLNAPLKLARVAEILRAADIKKGVARWCEKTPKNVLFIGRILAALDEDVRFINIVRDGRDVITSRHPKSHDQFYVGAERWITDVRAGLPFETHRQVLVIRYEDLVLKFQETLERICGFIEETVDERLLDWHSHTTIRHHPAWFDDVKQVHGHSIGRWQRPEYRDLVSRMMSDRDAISLLKHYGYVSSDTKAVGAWKPRAVVRRCGRRIPANLKRAFERCFSFATESGEAKRST